MNIKERILQVDRKTGTKPQGQENFGEFCEATVTGI